MNVTEQLIFAAGIGRMGHVAAIWSILEAASGQELRS